MFVTIQNEIFAPFFVDYLSGIKDYYNFLFILGFVTCCLRMRKCRVWRRTVFGCNQKVIHGGGGETGWAKTQLFFYL